MTVKTDSPGIASNPDDSGSPPLVAFSNLSNGDADHEPAMPLALLRRFRDMSLQKPDSKAGDPE